MAQIHELTMVELAAAIRAGELSPVAVTDHYLRRTQEFNDQVGAFYTVTAELAADQALAAEKALAALERAHYRAMATQDQEPRPPAPDTWWPSYLRSYVAACGVPENQCERLALEIAQRPRPGGWAHAGLGVKEGLRALAEQGLPMGVVSNSDGTVAADLRRVGLCSAPDGPDAPDGGPDGPNRPDANPMAIILDSALSGVPIPHS